MSRKPRVSSGTARFIWLLVAAMCGFSLMIGHFAVIPGGTGWGDISFIVLFAVLGLIALFNAIRPSKT